MYYLEDHHSKNEYTCYIRIKGGIPFIGVWHGNSIDDVYNYIKEIEKRHNRSNQHYYIDNDFYNNHYSKDDHSYYYRFMIRKVNDWKQLKLQDNNINDYRKIA